MANSLARRGPLGLSLHLLAGCLVLTSCKTMESALSLGPERAQGDPNDSCVMIRNELDGTREHFTANIIGGIAAGVALGVITGLLTGDRSNRRQRAVRNAVIGGLAGAAGGYLRARAQRAKDREELRQAISSDVQRDTGRVTAMGSVLGRLSACRNEQVASVEQGFGDGSLTKEQAREELQAIRAGVEGDNALVDKILGNITERRAIYVESIAKVEEKTEEEVLGDAASYTPTEPVTEEPETQEAAATSRYFAVKNSNVRAEPSNDARILGVLSVDAAVDVVGVAPDNSRWYEIRYKDDKAYVFAELLETEKAEPTDQVLAGPASEPKSAPSARPEAENDIQEFEIARREVSAEQQMASAELFRKIQQMEELTLI